MWWFLAAALAGPVLDDPAPEAPVIPNVGDARGEVTGLEPGPWTVAFADGSGNVTRVARRPDDAVITWEYHPVRPEHSSSGVYSGGEPAAGELAPERALALWKRLRALEADPAVRAERRELGTGRLTISTGDGVTELLLLSGPAAELAAFLAQ